MISVILLSKEHVCHMIFVTTHRPTQNVELTSCLSRCSGHGVKNGFKCWFDGIHSNSRVAQVKVGLLANFFSLKSLKVGKCYTMSFFPQIVKGGTFRKSTLLSSWKKKHANIRGDHSPVELKEWLFHAQKEKKLFSQWKTKTASYSLCGACFTGEHS